VEDWVAAGAFSIRFAGAALDDPDSFDYVDTNPRSVLAGQRALALARHTGKPLVVTSDASYPGPADWSTFLALTDSRRMTPQYLLTDPELRAALPWLDDDQWAAACRATNEVAERLKGMRLPKAPLIHLDGDLNEQIVAGKEYRLKHQHIAQWTEAYEQRLQREVELIREKKFESYFLVVGDLVRWAKTQMLVGPGRGSAAGSLVCYLLQITEVDPLPHHLLFERFIDINRADLPDIDIDFSDQHRDKVFTYLAEKYGKDHVARLGNISTLKPRSVMAECGKRLGIPAHATFALRDGLIEYSSGDSRYGNALEDTLTQTAAGRNFVQRYPESEVMRAAEGHAWHTGVHAAGVLVSNLPIIDYCVVRDGVAHLDKPDSEYLNLLKIDALGLRTLGVIEEAGCVTAQQLYDLKLDDVKVFDIFNQQRYAGLFQFEGAAQRRVSMQVHIDSFQKLDHITALARPGPLGGGATDIYVIRLRNNEAPTFRHPSMRHYLGDTMGVVLYQEQVMRIVRELGQFSWSETSTIRKAMSGRKGVEFFDQQRDKFIIGAATQGIAAEDAKHIWEEICSFGAWGMNKSHTVSYAVISYWCGFMKAYHPMEYAAALLRNAKNDDQILEILRELVKEGITYKPFDPALSEINWAVKDGVLYGGFINIHGVGPAKAAQLVARRNADKLTKKDLEVIAGAALKFIDLQEAHTLWGDLYARPEAHKIKGPIKQLGDMRGEEQAALIVKVIRRERRDENETIRLARRGGVRKTGQTLFLDIFAVDDSVSQPLLLRVRPPLWFTYGERLADGLRDGQDWLLVRGRWLGFYNMMIVEKVRCLTQSELV